MNKSLILSIISLILWLGSFFLSSKTEGGGYIITLTVEGIGVLIGLFAIIKSIGEIKRKERKGQAVAGLLLGILTGIVPLVLLAGFFLLILMYGAG